MTAAQIILIVNRNPRNADLLSEFLERRGYLARAVGSLEEFDHVLDGGDGYSLALIDVGGFNHEIWSRCTRLRAASVPFLLISSPMHSVGTEQGLRHGATGVLTKPLAMSELANLIDTLVL
jgi:DNA-binding response OmpR family regulator